MSIAARVVAAEVLNGVEERLPKVIDARIHGALDYAHAAFFLGMAWRWHRKQPRAAVAALFAGSFLLAQALFTDYPLGLVKVLPFSAHGRMDKAFAASSRRFPNIFGFDGATESAVFKGNTVFEVAVAGMTDYENARARRQPAA